MAQTQTRSGAQTGATSALDVVINVFVLVLGIMLGLVDQRSNADSGLRIPALIAALMLVGDALNNLIPRKQADDPVAAELDADAPPPAEANSSAISLLLLALAIWLGISTLMYQDAEPQLTGLSLLAAFLIFYRGLSDMPGR